MDETRYLIGADLGTTAVKVGLFDTSGRVVAVDTVEHTLITPATGVVEQNPSVYWDAFRSCLLRVLDAAGINRQAILAMSLSVQGETLAPLDDAGNLEFAALRDERGHDLLARRSARIGSAALALSAEGALCERAVILTTEHDTDALEPADDVGCL